MVRLPGEAAVRDVQELLDLAFDPDTCAWLLDRDGTWSHNDGEVELQELLIENQRRIRR